MLFSCGSEKISIFNEKISTLFALQMNDAHKARVDQEFLMDGFK